MWNLAETAWRRAPAVLGAVGTACLLWVGLASLDAMVFERDARARWAAGHAESGAGVRTGDVIGILEIPRLEFSEIVAEGDGADVLRVTLGHLPDTPLPWEPGNTAIAGHRDGRFGALRRLRPGDRLTWTTRRGTHHYMLEDVWVVEPTDLSVLAPTEERTLTLITCYPFSYVGNAPHRFVVRARAVDPRAD